MGRLSVKLPLDFSLRQTINSLFCLSHRELGFLSFITKIVLMNTFASSDVFLWV